MEPVAQLFADRCLLRHPARRRAAHEQRARAISRRSAFEETRELQQILEKRGYDVGRIDGVLGLKSRVAIRDTQIKFGLPADGWPTAICSDGLRAGR